LASLEKLVYLVSNSRTSSFWQFQGKTKEGVRLEDLKIQGVLRHGKGLKSNKVPKWKKSILKAEAVKIGLSGLGYRSIRFFQNRYSLIRV
jgi:hypothetical protein